MNPNRNWRQIQTNNLTMSKIVLFRLQHILITQLSKVIGY